MSRSEPPPSSLLQSSRRYSDVFFATLPPIEGPKALEVENVTVVFDGRTVLEDVTFWVPVGEFLCLSGPNGAGKSTLLKVILGLVKPKYGRVKIGGTIGYVPQRKAFDREFPATPLDVVVANLRGTWPLRITKDERDIAMEVLKRTGAQRLAKAQMRDLSGGETQRVFLARALVTKPTLLVLDEPTAGVDVGGRAAIVDLMAEISASETIAAILVTHNIQAIARCAERVIYLDKRIRAWGLWTELAKNPELGAIQVADHPAAKLDTD